MILLITTSTEEEEIDFQYYLEKGQDWNCNQEFIPDKISEIEWDRHLCSENINCYLDGDLEAIGERIMAMEKDR